MSQYPESWMEYLYEFHVTRDYFECHEILEEYWKQHEMGGPNSDTWVGLIQVAVAMYHHRRGNQSGAVKMLRQALHRLRIEKLEQLGIDGALFIERLSARKRQFEVAGDQYVPFEDLNMPLSDSVLVEQCTAMAEAKQLRWAVPSRMEDIELIHRHTRRDRSTVIKARQAALEAKQGER